MADLEADEQPAEAGIIDRGLDQRPVGDGDDLGGIIEVEGGAVVGLRGLLGGLFDDGDDDLVLGLEVVVEGAEPDVGLLGDLVDAGGVDALAGEDGSGGLDEPGPGPFTAAGLPVEGCVLGGGGHATALVMREVGMSSSFIVDNSISC